MKTIKLTQGKVALIDDEDFDRINKFKWTADKSKNTFYAIRRRFGKKIYLHRVIINIEKGQIIDHIDGNGLNNQKSNLRICTQSENSMNKKKKTGNIGKFKGVHWNEERKKWKVEIKKKEKRIFLGRFDNQYEAAIAYDQAAIKYFGNFARLNFPINIT